jgi:hypothetical protein
MRSNEVDDIRKDAFGEAVVRIFEELFVLNLRFSSPNNQARSKGSLHPISALII